MDRSHWTDQQLVRAYSRLMVARAREEPSGYDLAMAGQLLTEIRKRRARIVLAMKRRGR